MENSEYTLEQMRTDYQALKETLSKQEIINDRLLRETMKCKVKNIKSKVAISMACGICVILMSPFVFHYNPVVNASWWFIAGTDILMATCLFLDWKFNHKMQDTDLSHCDLLSFAKEAKETKSHYKNWIKWGFILGFVWALWLCAEVWSHSSEPKLAMGMIVGIIVGLIIGGAAGLKMDRAIIRNCDEIIDQIEA